jgi:hypothetical protein
LSTAIAAQSQPVTISLVGGVTTAGGTVALIDCGSNRCARYTPPSATITTFEGIQIANADTFVYRACFAAQPATCDDGTVTVDITGTAGFSTVANIMRGTCIGCHAIPQAGASWSLVNGVNSTDKEAWCAVRFKTGVAEAGDPPLVNPANPAASLLYLKPQGASGHDGSLNATAAAPILNWIREGGFLTSEASQTCP